MNRRAISRASLAALSLLVVACSAATSQEDDRGVPASTDESEDELRRGTSCRSAGGTCKGISPGACGTSLFDPNGHWGSASEFSCGRGVGAGCCLPSCPQLAPPAPGFCSNGRTVLVKNKAGCSVGLDCIVADAGPADSGRTDSGSASNACTKAGGTCTGLSPSACGNGPFDPSGHWGSAAKFSCGGAIGVGCCLPSCPELIPPPNGFCDGGPSVQITNEAGCTVGFACQ